MVMVRESRILEYKRNATDLHKIAKTAVAFANGNGGQIIIGVDDRTRSIKGVSLDQLDELLEKVPVSMADQIQPVLLPQVFEKNLEGKNVLIIEVFPGSQKPYYIASEGMEKGVYIRVGAHTRRAEGEVLDELRLLRSRLSYDEVIMPQCETKALLVNQIPLNLQSEKGLLSLDILKFDQHSGMLHPTRGAILMLHSHPEKYVPEAYIIASRMLGVSGRDTVESTEIFGNLPHQSEAAYDWVMGKLSRDYKIVKNRYQPTRSALPPEAVREVINNALFHRQYSIPGPIKIALYGDRLEIFSPGHFAGPFIQSELGDGTSYIRNRVICTLARRMALIEKRGTGIRVMIDSMEKFGLQSPVFGEGQQWFKVTLPLYSKDEHSDSLSGSAATILKLFEKKSLVGSVDVCSALHISKATAVALLQKMILQGLLVKTGSGPKTRYEIKKR